jgi:hypothetical protein
LVHLTTANQRALGISGFPPGGQPDGTIYVNMSIVNIDRVNIDPTHFDLIAVVSHEIDEVLGTASGLTTTNTSVADLYRYSSTGARNYTTAGDDAYLSIDGGVTDLVRYNQSASGDYGDWWSTGAHTPRVQDAFATQGATPNLGVELTLLDVVGYNLATAPLAAPKIGSTSQSGGTFSFSWSSIAGRTYQVQYKTNFTQASWLNLGGSVVASSSTTVTSDSMAPNPRRYYRVALLPSSTPSFNANFAGSVVPTLRTNYFLPAPGAGGNSKSSNSADAFEIETARPVTGGVVRLKGL